MQIPHILRTKNLMQIPHILRTKNLTQKAYYKNLILIQNSQRLRINYPIKIYPWIKHLANMPIDHTWNGNRLLSPKCECASWLTCCWTIYNLEQ